MGVYNLAKGGGLSSQRKTDLPTFVCVFNVVGTMVMLLYCEVHIRGLIP